MTPIYEEVKIEIISLNEDIITLSNGFDGEDDGTNDWE